MTADLVARLEEACRTPAGNELPDHAEPWGADVALLREAASALRSSGEAAMRQVRVVRIADDSVVAPWCAIDEETFEREKHGSQGSALRCEYRTLYTTPPTSMKGG